MQPHPRDLLGDLAARHPAVAAVLERLGLDYCCGGRRTLKQAAVEAGIPLSRILEEIQAASLAPEDPRENWSRRPLSELVDHLVERHHAYARSAMERLPRLVAKVRAAHGERRPELARVAGLLEDLFAELGPHLAKEEDVLFPYLARLESRPAGILPPPLEGPLTCMRAEHESAANLLSALRVETGGFLPPPEACVSYRALYAGLAEFETDLKRHIHLENNVLFPRAEAFTRAAGPSPQ